MTNKEQKFIMNSDTTASPINRRRVSTTMGGMAAGSMAISGLAGAHINEGKGISWVAFCGCDGVCNIRYIQCNDEGELGAIAYDCDGGTVYYKAGRNIYRHEYTRRNEDDDIENDINWEVIEINYAGNEDPVALTNLSDSRNLCGIPNNSVGEKFEEDEIRE